MQGSGATGRNLIQLMAFPLIPVVYYYYIPFVTIVLQNKFSVFLQTIGKIISGSILRFSAGEKMSS